MFLQTLINTPEEWVKDELQAKFKRIIMDYFLQRRKFVTVTENELKMFINTIKLFFVDIGKVTVTVRITAKADKAIEVVVLPEIFRLAAHTESGIEGLIAKVAVGGTVGAISGGMVGALLGAAAGAALTAVAGTSGRARLETAVEAGVGLVMKKDSCTAEEIFSLLAADGFKKTGDMIECTVRLFNVNLT